MENKQITVDCPCCASRLTIDVLSQTVMRALSPQEFEAGDDAKLNASRWSKAQGRVDDRGGKAKDKLESALSSERDKESRLDDLFDQASAKLKRREQERDDLDD